MRRVLFIAFDFPPISSPSSQRSGKLARYLRGHGWEPVVLAAEPGASAATDDDRLADVEGVEVHHVRPSALTRRAFSSPRVRLALNRLLVPEVEVLWRPAIQRAAESLLEQSSFDLVYTTCGPFSLNAVGARLRRRGLPWVTDFRDLWTGRVTYRPLTPLHGRIARGMERAAMQECDLFVANTPTFEKVQLARFPFLEGKSTCITNGFDPADFEGEPASLDGDAWNVLFVGSWYRRFYGDAAFRALAELVRSRPGVRLALHYVGSHGRHVRETAARAGCGDCVVDHGTRSRAETVALVRAADLLLFVLPDSEEARAWTPAKLYEYLASGKPILGTCPEGDASRLLGPEDARLSPDAAPETEGLEAVTRLHDAWSSGRRTVTRDLEEYQHPRLAERLARAFDRALEQRDP